MSPRALVSAAFLTLNLASVSTIFAQAPVTPVAPSTETAVAPAAPATLAPLGLPKGYLLATTYVGGKLEAMPLDSIELKNVYGGSIKNASGGSYDFANKQVTAVLCMDGALYDKLDADVGGNLGTFLRNKVKFVDATGSRSSASELNAQKAQIADLVQKNSLGKGLDKLTVALDAAILRSNSITASGGSNPAAVASASAKPAPGEFSFTTRSGKVFRNATVSSVTEDSVSLMTNSGVERVPLTEIPDGAVTFPADWKEKIVGYQKAAAEKAEAERVAEEKAIEEAAALKRAEEEKAAAEKAAKDKAEAEKAEKEKAALEKAEAEKVAKERAAEEKAAQEAAAKEKAAK